MGRIKVYLTLPHFLPAWQGKAGQGALRRRGARVCNFGVAFLAHACNIAVTTTADVRCREIARQNADAGENEKAIKLQ
jgi:hypothetical protein